MIFLIAKFKIEITTTVSKNTASVQNNTTFEIMYLICLILVPEYPPEIEITAVTKNTATIQLQPLPNDIEVYNAWHLSGYIIQLKSQYPNYLENGSNINVTLLPNETTVDFTGLDEFFLLQVIAYACTHVNCSIPNIKCFATSESSKSI